MEQSVYFFAQNEADFIKIGMTKSNDVSDRFKAFCTYSPKGGRIIGIIKTDNALLLEQKIHKELNGFRLSGEFFNITELQAKELILRYSNDKQIQIMNDFYILLSNSNDIELGLIKDYLKNKVNNINSKCDIPLYKLISKDNADELLTSTEIYNYIKSKEPLFSMSLKKFGSELRFIGLQRKSVRNGLKSNYKYLVKLL